MIKQFSILTVSCLLLAAMGLSAAQAAPFLADRHVQRGAKCQVCHATAQVKPGAVVKNTACQSCHGDLDKVAKRTQAKHLDPDPHYNHLIGLQCQECHQGHRASVNMCSQCHNLKFKVP